MPSSKSSLWTQKVKLKSCIHGVINLDYKSKKKKKIWGLLILLAVTIIFSCKSYYNKFITSSKSIFNVATFRDMFLPDDEEVSLETYTAWKVPVFGVILVFIFPHSDWMIANTDTFTKWKYL